MTTKDMYEFSHYSDFPEVTESPAQEVTNKNQIDAIIKEMLEFGLDETGCVSVGC